MIEVKNLVKRYGDAVAVNDVSFSIGKGEVVGFLGPNGAGKTTTMNILTGYISYSDGSVKIGGYDILEDPYKAKQLIGYLPEFPPLYPDMTVSEYLDFVFDLKKCKLPKTDHLDQICAVTKLDDVRHRLIRNLSKGYKQRTGLAQALIGNPEILILDEPTVGLDPREIKEIRNLIRKLGENHTVILSSHILSEIQAVCERVLIINQGYLVKDSSTDELLNMTGSGNRYAVRLTATGKEIIDDVKRLPGVVSVEFAGVFEKGTVDIVIDAEKDTDIRKSLFDLCALKNIYILMITPLGVSLEDIFIELVGGDPEKEAKELIASKKQMLGQGRKKYKKIIRKIVDKDGNLLRTEEKLVEIDGEESDG